MSKAFADFLATPLHYRHSDLFYKRNIIALTEVRNREFFQNLVHCQNSNTFGWVQKFMTCFSSYLRTDTFGALLRFFPYLLYIITYTYYNMLASAICDLLLISDWNPKLLSTVHRAKWVWTAFTFCLHALYALV